MEVPKGMATTLDTVVEGVVTQPQRKKKPPVLSKKQRGERKVQIDVRKEEINNERIKHNEAVGKATPERQRLLKNLQGEKKRHQAEVDKLLDDHFASSSSGKLMDRILQSEMVQPKLNQLQGNIDKLDGQITWHRGKLAALSAEQTELDKEHDHLVADDLAEDALEAYTKWKDAWLVAEHSFEQLKQSTLKARSLDRNFAQRLARFGKRDETFVLVVDSKLKDEFIGEVGQAALVDELSKLYHLGDSNWAYQDPNVSVSRRLKTQEPLRRETFDVGAKIATA